MTMHDTKKLTVATIMPGPQPSASSAHLTQGTKVILSDGRELAGVTRITLHAEAGDIWKATIEVHPQTVHVIAAEADTRVVECISLGDESRRYAMGRCGDPDDSIPIEGTVLLEGGERIIPHGV